MKRFTLSTGGSLTILLITQDQIVRADFASRGGKIKALSRCPRPMGEELPALVDAALRLDRRKPKRVFILASEIWTQVLGLHSSATNGINDAELARALTFEAEALSGLSAFDSEAALVPLGSDGSQRLFWIVQLPRWQRDQLDETVRQAGGTLAGVAHPAALPTSLCSSRGRKPTGAVDPASGADPGANAPGSGSRWQRVELWSHSVVAVDGHGDAITRLHVVNADPRTQGWHDEVETWFGDASSAVREQLVEDQGLADSAAPRGRGAAGEPLIEPLILDDDASLGAFLSQWARQLSKSKPAVPLVRPASKPLTKQQRSSIAAVLALVVGAGVGADYVTVHREISQATQETATLRQKTAGLDAIKKKSTEAGKNIEKIRKDLDTVRHDVKYAVETLEKYRVRHARLLALLAEFCPDNLVIQSISYDGSDVKLSGRALGPHAANEFATDLVEELHDIGWRVQPAHELIGPVLLRDGDPWDFNVELSDLPVDSPTAKLSDIPFFRGQDEAVPERRERLQPGPKFRFTADGIESSQED